MSVYIYAYPFDDLDPSLARIAVGDFLGEDGLATIIVDGDSRPGWIEEIESSLGLDTVSSDDVEVKHLDTVIGPPVEEAVAQMTASGATYLDISEGLLPIEVAEEEEIPENPDLDNLPEEEPEEDKKSTSQKAAEAKKAVSARRRSLPKPPEPVSSNDAPAKKTPVKKAPAKKPAAKTENETPVHKQTQPVKTSAAPSKKSDLVRQLIIAELPDVSDESTLWKILWEIKNDIFSEKSA